GVSGDYVWLGRAASLAEQPAQAILLFEEALNLFRHIRDHWGEALALEGQGEELLKLEAEAMNAGLAALWQAREIFRTLDASSAQRLDAFFEQMQARVDTQVGRTG